ncbi:MAG: hypothetical protein GSR79_02360 [Desulfurococcales archaeon]|nr:hypothetical protein [Desulfurococcales archaeon]
MYSPTAHIREGLPINGYAGHSGRFDVIVRSILASAINEKSCFTGFLGGNTKRNGTKTLMIFDTLRLRSLSEKSLFIMLYRCFRNKHKCENIIIEEIDYSFLINKLRKTGYSLFLLDEKGDDYCRHLREIITGKNAFIMGAHEDIPIETLSFFEKYSAKISIGPKSLHTSHVITYLSTVLKRIYNRVTPCPKF